MTAARMRPWLIAFVALYALVVGAFAFRNKNELVNCYLKAAAHYVAGEDIFTPTINGVGLWVYPPFMVLPVAPLALVPSWLARLTWSAAIVAAAIGSVMILTRAVLPSELAADERRRRVICLIVAAVICEKHLLSPLTYLSHDWFIALSVVVGFALSARRRDALAGVAFGIGAALKVTPGLFLPVLLVQRRWRAAAAMTITIAVASILPDFVRPANSGSQLASFVTLATGAADLSHAGGGHWAVWNVQAQNISAIITRVTSPTPTTAETKLDGDWSLVHLSDEARRGAVLAALALIGLAVMAVAVLAERRARSASPQELALVRLNECGAVACGMVLLAPHSSKYHFAVVGLATVSCLLFATRRRDPLVVTCIALMLLLGLPTGRDLIGDTAADIILMYGSVGLVAVAGLVGCLRIAWLERNAALSTEPATAAETRRRTSRHSPPAPRGSP